MSDKFFKDKFLFDYGKEQRVIITERGDGLFNVTLIDDKNGPPKTLSTSDLFVFFRWSLELIGTEAKENGITYWPPKEKE